MILKSWAIYIKEVSGIFTLMGTTEPRELCREGHKVYSRYNSATHRRYGSLILSVIYVVFFIIPYF